MAKYVVIYDSCILYSFTLRNIFIELALAELFQAKWTEQINEEWVSSLSKKNPPQKVRVLREKINAAVPDCLVNGYESLIPGLHLPDPNDNHVLAAAIQSGAQAIITNNIKDFPQDSLNSYNIEAIDPDRFITFQMDLAPGKVLSAVKWSRQRLKTPHFSADEYLSCIKKKGLVQTAAILSPYAELI